jgi:uncharacterized OsmC-like protein
MNTVTVVNHGDAEFVVQTAYAQVVLGTEGKNLTALDGFLGSIAACMGFYVRLYATQESIALNGFTIAVSGELSTDRPYRFTALTVDITLPGSPLDAAGRGKLAEFVRSCPLYHTLITAPHMTIRVP